MIQKKLIRDNIPEIAKKNWDILKTFVANEEEYKNYLFEKLLEEAQEVVEKKNNSEKLKSEIWDLLEVLDTIYKLQWLDIQEILQMKQEKWEKNGRFEKRLILNIEKTVENLEKSLKFDKWNEEKQRTDKKNSTVFFKERDIFFLKAGKNIGFEQNGKWEKFARPFIVIKKFNNNIFWGIPLSTKEKKWKYYHSFLLKNTKQTAILSQFKIIDSKRLLDKIGMIDKENFDIIKQKIKNLL